MDNLYNICTHVASQKYGGFVRYCVAEKVNNSIWLMTLDGQPWEPLGTIDRLLREGWIIDEVHERSEIIHGLA